MEKLKQIFLLILMVIIAASCNIGKKEQHRHQASSPEKAKPKKTSDFDFPLNKGTNISHWLSQSDVRGKKRKNFFTEKDVKTISHMGMDFVRIPIDGIQMWDKQGNKHEEAFQLLHNAINWCEKYGLRVIVDLHQTRFVTFNRTDNPLWNSPVDQRKFIGRWMMLSKELHTYSTDSVAYELLNEPTAPTAEDWNKLASRTIKTIRKREPKRMIVLGSNRWESISTFDDLKVPKNDPNIILSFHFYTPMLLTHHEASWVGFGDYNGPG